MIAEKSDVRYVQFMGSPAHTYGNVLAFMEKWFIDQFPKRDNNESIFRSIHVSSKLAHHQLRSVKPEIYKRIKPSIVFRPRVDISDDRFLKGTSLIERNLKTPLDWGVGAYQPFFEDVRSKTKILYHLNRTVMYIDIAMFFSTLMQQMNYAAFIQNTIPIGHPFNIQTCLESFLPLELMEVLSEVCGVPIVNKDDNSVHRFLKFMNENSQQPVTFKLQGSTNTKEFFRYYPVNMDVRCDSIDLNDGEKNGQVTDSYQISMSFRIEFYSTGFYYLFSNDVFKVNHPIYEDDSVIVPIYTDLLLKEDLVLQPGWQLLNRASTILEKEYDKVNIECLMRPSVKEVVKYFLKNGFSLYNILDIKVRKQGELLSQGIDYVVNYENYDVEFKNLEYGFYTYTIMICVNVDEINNLVKTIYHLE